MADVYVTFEWRVTTADDKLFQIWEVGIAQDGVELFQTAIICMDNSTRWSAVAAYVPCASP